jgi:hypothetical protein
MMRLSQAEFAAAVRAAGEAMGLTNHCTKRLVQKWENGEHTTCRGDYLRILQAITGLSPRELGFTLQRAHGAAGPRADPLAATWSPHVDFAATPPHPGDRDPDCLDGDFEYTARDEHSARPAPDTHLPDPTADSAGAPGPGPAPDPDPTAAFNPTAHEPTPHESATTPPTFDSDPAAPTYESDAAAPTDAPDSRPPAATTAAIGTAEETTTPAAPDRNSPFTEPSTFAPDTALNIAAFSTTAEPGAAPGPDPATSEFAPDPTPHPAAPPDADPAPTDQVLEHALARLRYALEHPSTVDSHTANYVDTATARLYDLEHHSPARLIAPTVERHLASVTALLTAARHETVRRRLLGAAGSTTALAGWVAFDRGDIATANRFWDIALSAAETTHDDSLYACCFTFMSFAAARRGDPCSAWQMAHTAGCHTVLDPRAASWAIGLVALHAAELGQKEEAVAALDLSLENGAGLSSSRPGDGTDPWTRQFDRARLYSCAARTAALLDDTRASDFATQAVSSLGPARVKSRAVVLAEATLATALAGEFELSLDYGSVAAVLTRELEVSTAADVLYSAIPVLMSHSTARAVRELLPQLTQLSRFPGRH